jgi:translation initiation factor IF-2
LTAEQIELMRQGRSLRDILARTRTGGSSPPAATPAGASAPSTATPPPRDAVARGPVAPISLPVPPSDADIDDEEGRTPKSKGLPGRADRQKARQDRAKKRLSASAIEIVDGHVEAVEDDVTSRARFKPRRVEKRQPGTVERKGKVPLEMPITLRKASEAFGAPVGKLLFKLMEHGIKGLNINSVIDQEVAELLALDFGVEIEIRKPVDVEDELIKSWQVADDPSSLQPRAPVVTIMGHVDHGKTSLLDAIRKSRVVDTEAGGITQVIRAWRVERNGKPITFLDTPGHEAFTKMRARGAHVTDVVVIVVAANDGVMPQTEEAISHARAAGVPIVVAINKVDLPNANVKRTEQQLYGLNLIPDTMGGDTPFCYTSAVTGKGIDDLLDMILLVADLRELKANPNKPAMGTCLEAHLRGTEGVFATLLVQQGTLHKGDIVICGCAYGRVRAMYNDLGRSIAEAGPSMPVRITGLDEIPDADDRFYVVGDLAKAREIAEKRRQRKQEAALMEKARVPFTLETMGQAKIAELKVIIKADFRGSIEAITKELEKLIHEEVRVRILHTGIGAINVSDVQLAMTSPQDTIIVGFNVVPDNEALALAQAHGIQIREYSIIYNLTDDVKQALAGKLKPREEVVHLGRAVVQQLFKISRVGTIAGCMVTQGVIERNAKVRVIRDGAVVYPPADRTASLESLKRHKDDVREVREGFDCGLKIAGYDDVKVGDVIEAYRVEQIQRTL